MAEGLQSGTRFVLIWEFPTVMGTLFWGPYNSDLTIKGTILVSPFLGNPHMKFRV